mmetsp:Transcript_70576/g.222945  ORF Transcript_70576/g.222945 Transcript_70576/m.222945 type:complete len:392 (+) Transcript_70576:112-1287(+)
MAARTVFSSTFTWPPRRWPTLHFRLTQGRSGLRRAPGVLLLGALRAEVAEATLLALAATHSLPEPCAGLATARGVEDRAEAGDRGWQPRAGRKLKSCAGSLLSRLQAWREDRLGGGLRCLLALGVPRKLALGGGPGRPLLLGAGAGCRILLGALPTQRGAGDLLPRARAHFLWRGEAQTCHCLPCLLACLELAFRAEVAVGAAEAVLATAGLPEPCTGPATARTVQLRAGVTWPLRWQGRRCRRRLRRSNVVGDQRCRQARGGRRWQGGWLCHCKQHWAERGRRRRNWQSGQRRSSAQRWQHRRRRGRRCCRERGRQRGRQRRGLRGWRRVRRAIQRRGAEVPGKGLAGPPGESSRRQLDLPRQRLWRELSLLGQVRVDLALLPVGRHLHA